MAHQFIVKLATDSIHLHYVGIFNRPKSRRLMRVNRWMQFFDNNEKWVNFVFFSADRSL